jgi:hypothetical protein
MIDDENLENYVEVFYEGREGDYRVRADTGENFFQVSVQHDEDPGLDELVSEIFDSLAMREDRWYTDIESGETHSHLYVSKGYEEELL